MPRDEYLIQTFDKGIISSADQSDIAEGAAAWSIDENPESIPGTVQPRLTDTVYTEHTSNQFCIEKHSWITREDGKHDLVFYNAKGGTIDAISDFDSVKTYGVVDSNTIGTGKTISMNTINRAVRLGYGNNPSKYVGYIDHGQFGSNALTSLQYEDAELAPPSIYPALYKIISDTTYIYGIEWQGRKIIKVTASSGVYTESTLTFNSLQGICDIDATYFYLFDAIGQYGNLYKINKSDLTIAETYYVVGWETTSVAANSVGIVSDIELTTNKIWFSFYNEATGFTLDHSGKIIYNFALASLTDGGTVVPTDVTWTTYGCNDSTTEGNVIVGTFALASGTGLWIDTSRTAFVKTVAGEIGVLVATGNINRLKYSIDVGGVTHYKTLYDYCDTAIIFMNESSAKDDYLNSTNTRLRSFASGVIYYSALKMTGSVKTDYLLLPDGVVTTSLGIYFSDGTDEFLLSDAVWNVTIGDTPVGGTPITDTKWQTYTTSGTDSITNIGSIANRLAAGIESISTKDVTVRIFSSLSGNGKYLTRIYDTTAFSGSTSVYKSTTPFTFSVASTSSTDGTFDITKKYFYKIALEYDSYQISPLSTTAPASCTVSAVTDVVDVTLQIYSTATLSPRVTGILIYRAEASGTTKLIPETLYRLAGRVEVKLAWALDASETATWGTKKISTFTDTGIYGPSYETESGCPETLSNNTMDYTISCTGAGYHFVGQGYNDELDKVSNLIFRSKKNAPDTFDWSNDFCVLPTMPIALHYFKGYLYAWDVSKMYVIDPEALVLIGEYVGYGIQSDLTVCSDENAMYFANNDNIYMHDGKTPSIISYPINQIGTSISGATSHRTLASASARTIVMKISPKWNSLVIAYMKYTSTLDTYTPMFVYHLTKQSWYYWLSANTTGTYIDYTTADKRSLIVDYLGDIYLSAYKGIEKLCGSANGATCTWYSKLINFGDDTTLKKIYKVIWNGTCDGYIGYNTPSTITTQLTSGSYINTTKYLTMQLKFSITSGEILRGITIIFRRMVGLR